MRLLCLLVLYYITLSDAVVASIYPSLLFEGLPIELEYGMNLTKIEFTVSSCRIPHGYALRFYEEPNFVGIYGDVIIDWHNLYIFALISVQSAKMIRLNETTTPFPGTVWWYDHQNREDTMLQYLPPITVGDVFFSYGAIEFGYKSALIVYSKPKFLGEAVTYTKTINVTTPFRSMRVLTASDAPSQILLPNTLWIFSGANYEGDRQSVHLGDTISSLTTLYFSYEYLGSIQIPPNWILIGYSETQQTGPFSIWDSNVSDFLAMNVPILSFHVLHERDRPKRVVPDPCIKLVFNVSASVENVPHLRLPLGENEQFNTRIQVAEIIIPTGLALITYKSFDFKFDYSIWTNSTKLATPYKFLSYKVVLASDIADWLDQDPPPDTVYVYGGSNYRSEHIIVPVGSEVPYLLDLYPSFGADYRFVGSIKIPLGLKLVAYSLPDFRGKREDYFGFTPAIVNMTIQSFHVANILTEFPRGSMDEDTSVYAYAEKLVRFPIQCEYPRLSSDQDASLVRVVVPPGWQIIGYTRPFFMGLSHSWVNETVQSFLSADTSIYLSTTRIRSFKVIPFVYRAESLIVPQERVYMLASFAGLRWYYPGETDPCMSPWLGKTIFMRYYFIPSETTGKLVWYEKCHYEGNPVIFTGQLEDRADLSKMKSYKVLSLDAPVESESEFVGLYRTWFHKNDQALYLRMNEEMSQLYVPWNANIDQLIVTPGVVVLGYDKPGFGGNCMWWTSMNSTSNDNKISIDVQTWRMQSVRTMNLTTWGGWKTCVLKMDSIFLPTRETKPTTTFKIRTPTISETRFDDEMIQPSLSPLATPKTTTGPAAGSDSASNNTKLAESGISPSPSMKPKVTTNLVVPNQTKYLSKVITPPPEMSSFENIPPRKDQASTPGRSLLSAIYPLLIVSGAFALFVVYYMSKRSRPNTKSQQCVAFQWRDLDLYQLEFHDVHLQSQLASGSSGVIWLATFLKQPVAVKVLHPGNTDDIQKFIDEVDMWAKLESPYIVALVGAAWTQSTDLMAVMEYMNMGDLRTNLSNTTPSTFAWTEKLTCLYRIVQGLFYLHSKQLLHRDLKSRNVLHDTEKGTKLCDFGSSKDDGFGATMTAMVGTFRWMAPEMLLFQKYSYPVDIYSFGVIMCEMETHMLPYDDLQNSNGQCISNEQVIRMVLHEGLKPTLSSTCPIWYKQLALQCLSIEAADRPSVTKIMLALHYKLSDIGLKI